MSMPANQKRFSMPTPPDLEAEWDNIITLPIGSSRRITHNYQESGEPCSVNKDACMICTHYSEYVYYYCFRCKMQGKVYKKDRSPIEVLRDMKKPDREPIYSAHGRDMSLPKDCVDMEEGPKEAQAFLAKYGFNTEMYIDYGIFFSHNYDRIIFPVYRGYFSGLFTGLQMVGWTGRCYHPYDKETRQQMSRPKYLTKKDLRENRIYWNYLNPDSKVLVIVEDVISAIKIAEAEDLNVSVMALLNTKLGDDIIPWLRTLDLYLWLDNDAEFDSLKTVNRLTSLGYNAHSITTKNDPKMYSSKDMLKVIKRAYHAT